MHHHKVQINLLHLLLVAIAYCLIQPMAHVRTMAQATRTPSSTPSPADRLSPTLSISTTTTITAPIPLFIFSTPPPVRNEPPLTSGFRNIPSVFPGIDEYHAVRAQIASTSTKAGVAENLREAIESVVQILRCDQFGCDTPVGTGVIVHPSGLILTAYHVLLETPNDLTSPRYQDFVIAMTDNVRTPPVPRYHAFVVSDKNEQDIALLAIDRDLDEEPIDPNHLGLSALPFADVELLFADTLHILGYPLDGGDAVNYIQATFTSFDDDGQLIVVDKSLRPGNSGGPALALQEGQMTIAGLVIRGRSTEGRLDQEGILRTIDQVAALNWTPDYGRALGQNIQIVERTNGEETVLQLSIDLTTVDLMNESLRLLFYVTDNATGQPWQPPGTEGPLALWADLVPQQFIDTQTIRLTIPVNELGTTPDHLTFYGMLWSRAASQSIWADAHGVQLVENSDALALEAELERQEESQVTNIPTVIQSSPVLKTPTPQPTATPRPLITPTANQQATTDAVGTAVALTLEALVSPTPTIDLVAAQLTEVAKATATALAQLPAATYTPISTTIPATPIPTSTKPACDVVGTFGAIWLKYSERLGCNVGIAFEDAVTYQPFAQGYMVWIKSTDAIYILPFGGKWSSQANLWHPDDPLFSCPEAESAGNLQMGFGKIWCTMMDVRTSLGQPRDAERPLGNAQKQIFDRGTVFEILGGRQIILFNDGSWIED